MKQKTKLIAGVVALIFIAGCYFIIQKKFFAEGVVQDAKKEYKPQKLSHSTLLLLSDTTKHR